MRSLWSLCHLQFPSLARCAALSDCLKGRVQSSLQSLPASCVTCPFSPTLLCSSRTDSLNGTTVYLEQEWQFEKLKIVVIPSSFEQTVPAFET